MNLSMPAIPVFRPSYDHEEIEALRRPFESGWIGLGPLTQEFEDRMKEYVGASHAVATNSCTSALHLALKVIGIDDAEVITTPITFVSTNHAILYNNGIPVFCDVEPDTLNIDTTRIEQLITSRTKVILVVHYGGHACDMDVILDIARRYRLHVVEDNAHGCGGWYKGQRLGSLGDLSCFSFHAVKNLATGEGGMVLTNNAEWDRRLRSLRWMGISQGTWNRSHNNKEYSWAYDIEEVGFKFHMNDVQAALGLVQLRKLDRLNAARRQVAQFYCAAFKDFEWLKLPVERDYANRSWHNFVIRLPVDYRDRMISFLKSEGISTSVHYYPNHLYPIYAPYVKHPLPVAETVWKTILTLPLYPDLTAEDTARIVDAVRQFSETIS